MQDFDKLDDLAKEMAQRDYLIKKRKHLAEELNQLSQEEIRLQSQLKKETHDYKSIENLSVKRLLKLFDEQYEEMMDKEYREMKIAEYKHDSLIEKMQTAQDEIVGITELLKNYTTIESEYKTLLNAKRVWATSNGHMEIDNFESELILLKGKQKEIEEAINACKQLILSLENAREDLSSAQSWGMFDILGGGLIPASVKHDYLKRASQYIKDSSDKAVTLTRELLDLKTYFSIERLEVDALTHTFDTFFDSVLSDLNIQEQIDKAYLSICNNHAHAEALMKLLDELKIDNDERMNQLKQKREKVLISL
ncbi:hypothetical protein QE109_14805 [Fusibacter bizertensis]|jgi:hypothetical protein|uniref:Uncharacterized protein n=1 Tax=Fusibacter bizertensis TaxID=1488331 RepID=A0ABT6NG77_9FIRM|nr:hypothetical protein [Fusibacter bizertensis]MDH8679426.1 hypothetical protein [Fusibacter bizertensis]